MQERRTSLRIHLLDADVPLKSGENYKANCGADISKAEFAFMFDADYGQDYSVSSLLCCRQCRTTRLAKRYLYGIVSGQETKGAAA
jgi:hypothetical protein